MISKHYVFSTKSELPQLDIPSLVQVTHEANAAAHLGCSTILFYLKSRNKPCKFIEFLRPFNHQKIDEKVMKAYNLGERLQENTVF